MCQHLQHNIKYLVSFLQRSYINLECKGWWGKFSRPYVAKAQTYEKNNAKPWTVRAKACCSRMYFHLRWKILRKLRTNFQFTNRFQLQFSYTNEFWRQLTISIYHIFTNLAHVCVNVWSIYLDPYCCTQHTIHLLQVRSMQSTQQAWKSHEFS